MAAAPGDHALQPGDLLAGRYRIEAVLGEGGMGQVLQAHHEHLDHKVAIKVMSSSAAGNPKRVERFKREAWAATKIKSDHVTRVLDVGELDTGAPYIVLEYLDGEDLFQVLRRRPLPIATAVDFVLQACEALAEAHAAGIVHRDLKPSNLFLTRRPDGTPWIKVLDFGISKLETGAALTKTRSLMGSPLYMAPEQMASAKRVDPRSDIWPLGVILYELISGGTPFEGETLPEICTRVLHSPPIPVRDFNEGVPEHFEHVLTQFLQKDPNHRPQNLAAVADLLEPWGSEGAAVSARYIRSVLGKPAPSTIDDSSTLPVEEAPHPEAITTAPETLEREAPEAVTTAEEWTTQVSGEWSAPGAVATPAWTPPPQVAPGSHSGVSGPPPAPHAWSAPPPPPRPSHLEALAAPGALPVVPEAPAHGPAPGPVSPGHTTSPGGVITAASEPSSSKAGWVGGAILALLLAAGVGIWLGSSTSAPPPEPTAATPPEPVAEAPAPAEDEADGEADPDEPPAEPAASASASGEADEDEPLPPSAPPVRARPPRPPPGWDPFDGR